MSPAPVHVPIEVSARRTDDGRLHRYLLLGTKDETVEGHFYCHAQAPNGREAEGEVDRLDYETIRKLFKKAGELALAVDPGVADAGEASDLRDLGMLVWTGGKTIEVPDKDFKPNSSAPYGVSPPVIGIDHIQVWSEPGAVTVTVWPDGGTLFPVPGLAQAQRRIRAVALGHDLRCSAYWGFIRHSTPHAVRTLGSMMLRKAAGEGTALSLDELIVAAHFLLNSTRQNGEVVARVLARLDDQGDNDSAILRWSILFDGLAASSDQNLQSAFDRAVRGLQYKGCRYTEVFRQFVQRLPDGEERWRSHAPPPGSADAMDGAIRWCKELARAAYWDTEYLTYRALDPRSPNATATDAELGSEAKKKSSHLHLPR